MDLYKNKIFYDKIIVDINLILKDVNKESANMKPVKTENIKKGKYSEKRRKTIGIRRIFLLSRSFL